MGAVLLDEQDAVYCCGHLPLIQQMLEIWGTPGIGTRSQRYNLMYQCYADDTQLYFAITSRESWTNVVNTLERCVADIGTWMSQNWLKLNHDKTEVIVFSPRNQLNTCIPTNISVKIGDCTISPVSSVRNLGIIMDSGLTLVKQVNSISKSCFFQIRKIGQIRRYITKDACRSLVQALVTSRLDYGNGLLHGLPQTIINRLQRVQNTAARLISKTKKRDHITPVLRELHWLPVMYRPRYKILTYVYKALNDDTAPAYLRSLVQKHQPARTLRSASKHLLAVPKTNTVKYGNQCFRKSAAVLWNELPENIKFAKTLISFKKLLKTYLFNLAYDS